MYLGDWDLPGTIQLAGDSIFESALRHWRESLKKNESENESTSVDTLIVAGR